MNRPLPNSYYVAFSGTDAMSFRVRLNASTLLGAKREATKRFGLIHSQQTMTVGRLWDVGTMYERGEPLCSRLNRRGSKWE